MLLGSEASNTYKQLTFPGNILEYKMAFSISNHTLLHVVKLEFSKFLRYFFWEIFRFGENYLKYIKKKHFTILLNKHTNNKTGKDNGRIGNNYLKDHADRCLYTYIIVWYLVVSSCQYTIYILKFKKVYWQHKNCHILFPYEQIFGMPRYKLSYEIQNIDMYTSNGCDMNISWVHVWNNTNLCFSQLEKGQFHQPEDEFYNVSLLSFICSKIFTNYWMVDFWWSNK